MSETNDQDSVLERERWAILTALETLIAAFLNSQNFGDFLKMQKLARICISKFLQKDENSVPPPVRFNQPNLEEDCRIANRHFGQAWGGYSIAYFLKNLCYVVQIWSNHRHDEETLDAVRNAQYAIRAVKKSRQQILEKLNS